jgi:cytidine deaminase
MVTDVQKNALIEAACAVRENAYAPYSNYLVGAAILVEDGRVFTGVNVENVSFGLSICAERTAVFKAVSEGFRKILAVAICTATAGSPCGACRQVLFEFSGDIPVWYTDTKGTVIESSLNYLIPDCFEPGHLDFVE